MAWNLDGQTGAVEQALGAGAAQHVGWFRFFVEDQRWEWSEQVQRMHGYEPGTVTPTTELVLAHKHPDDRDQVAVAIKDMINNHRPFSTRHRIVDTQGEVHHVIVVGDQVRDANGEVIGTHGFYIDITPGADRSSEEAISAKVAEIAERRAAIDQTKGMLMLVYGIDEATAFELLRWLSQENNVKVRLLAQQIAKDFAAVGDISTASRSHFDQLLLTAPQRAVDASD
jgi:PAS domain S-box-containing protein